MPRKAKVVALSLTEETRSALSVLAHSRTAPAHHVERFRCRVVGHTVRPPRDVHIGPHQHAAVFADLACTQSS